jgi:hypothetical protein
MVSEGRKGGREKNEVAPFLDLLQVLGTVGDSIGSDGVRSFSQDVRLAA